MTKFANKFLFWAHYWSNSPIFRAIFFSSKNSVLPSPTLYGFLTLYQNLENMDPIPRKRLDRQTNGWMDRKVHRQRQMDGWTEGWTDRPYFIGHFWLLPGVRKGFLSYINTWVSEIWGFFKNASEGVRSVCQLHHQNKLLLHVN